MWLLDASARVEAARADHLLAWSLAPGGDARGARGCHERGHGQRPSRTHQARGRAAALGQIRGEAEEEEVARQASSTPRRLG